MAANLDNILFGDICMHYFGVLNIVWSFVFLQYFVIPDSLAIDAFFCLFSPRALFFDKMIQIDKLHKRTHFELKQIISIEK